MADISQQEALALVRVLSLAENHQMWTSGRFVTADDDGAESYWDDSYAAIQTVRAFLKRNNVMTMHELTQRLAERQAEKLG